MGDRIRPAELASPPAGRRALAAIEVLLLPVPLALKALGVIRNPSLLLLLLGLLSQWLRREGWRAVGLRRPASWRRTLLLGIAIGVAYDAADILVLLPAIRRFTGQEVELGKLGELRGDLGALLSSLALVWSLAAFGEEMGYRGYALNRIADLLGRSRAAFASGAIVVGALFGLAHLSQGVTGVIDNVLTGWVFAALYLASGRNLWLPIIAHGVLDTTSLALLFLGAVPS